MARYQGLTGDGFIALQSDDPACNFIEHETLEGAQGWAAMRSQGKSVYVIYAPVAIVRPQVQSNVEVTAIGSKMVKQLTEGKKK